MTYMIMLKQEWVTKTHHSLVTIKVDVINDKWIPTYPSQQTSLTDLSSTRQLELFTKHSKLPCATTHDEEQSTLHHLQLHHHLAPLIHHNQCQSQRQSQYRHLLNLHLDMTAIRTPVLFAKINLRQANGHVVLSATTCSTKTVGIHSPQTDKIHIAQTAEVQHE